MPISNPLPFPALTQDKIWEGNASNLAVEVFHPTLPGAHHTPAVAPKVKLESRELNAASGDVAYTGYGFLPTGLIIIARLSEIAMSIGSVEPGLTEHCMVIFGSTSSDIKLLLVWIDYGAGKSQGAVLKTFDADGFTLTWTLAGAQAGTIPLHCFAFK